MEAQEASGAGEAATGAGTGETRGTWRPHATEAKASTAIGNKMDKDFMAGEHKRFLEKCENCLLGGAGAW